VNLMIVFLVSGLWHGASWKYVIWGGLHGIYQIIGDFSKNFKTKVNILVKTRTDAPSYKLGRIAITFILTCFAWIFFRANSTQDAFHIVNILFTEANPWAIFDGSLYELGLDRQEFNILFLSLGALMIVDVIKYRTNKTLDIILAEQNIWFRWICLLGIFFWLIILGSYGPEFDAKQFIYFQF
jgi:D-alanyl-lipoteichoic acid acyltransferase DltB (MBOAT superfamily)